MKRSLPALIAVIAACAPVRPDIPDEPAPIDVEGLRGITKTFREYVKALLLLETPAEAPRAFLELDKIHPYLVATDERSHREGGAEVPGLIEKAARGDEAARKELVRRGKIYDALQVYHQPFDRFRWDRARRTISELSVNRDGETYLTMVLCLMLLNGQNREAWPEIRFQLVELGEAALDTVAGVAAAKVAETPRTPLYKEEDLVQLFSVLVTFGEPGIAKFRPMAAHPNHNVRKAAARAAGDLKSEALLPELEALLRDSAGEDSWVVRAAAADALGRFEASRARVGPVLLAALKTEKTGTVVIRILRALGSVHHADAVPVLIGMLEGINLEWVEEAMEALYHVTAVKGLVTPAQWREWYQRSYPAWRKRNP